MISDNVSKKNKINIDVMMEGDENKKYNGRLRLKTQNMEEVEYSKVAEDLVRHVIQTAMKEVEEEDAANSVREKMDGEANDIALSKQTTQKSGTDVSFTAGRVYRTKNHRKRPTTGQSWSHK